MRMVKKNERDEMGIPRPMTRKQVQEALRRGHSLEDRDLRGVDLAGICFEGVSLRGAKLAEANLSGCSFRQADLSHASLWQANLQDAVLDGATLEETDLDLANLDGCTFLGARVRKAIFPDQSDVLHQLKGSLEDGSKLSMPDWGTLDDEEIS